MQNASGPSKICKYCNVECTIICVLQTNVVRIGGRREAHLHPSSPAKVRRHGVVHLFLIYACLKSADPLDQKAFKNAIVHLPKYPWGWAYPSPTHPPAARPVAA